MCFTCIGKVAEPVNVGVIQPAADKENVTNNPIENCSWDNIVVSTTLTNAGVVHAYVDQKVMPPNLMVRWFTLLKVKLWFITLPYD